jgi:hypothetical protein
MATNKRDRQRANRAEKQAVEAKAARRQKTLKLVRRIVIYGLLAAAVLLLANLLLGGGNEADAAGLSLLAFDR